MGITPVPSLDKGLFWDELHKYVASADLSTAADIVTAPPADQIVVIDDLLVSIAATAAQVTVQMETSNTVLGSVYLPVNGTACITLRGGIRGDTVGKKILAKTSVATAVAISVNYHFEPI